MQKLWRRQRNSFVHLVSADEDGPYTVYRLCFKGSGGSGHEGESAELKRSRGLHLFTSLRELRR